VEEDRQTYIRDQYSDSVSERPFVQVTTPSENWSPLGDQADKTVLTGFSTRADRSGRGLAAAAQVFLDLGAPGAPTEVNLELDREDLAPWSALLRMYLPDDPAFTDLISWRDRLLKPVPPATADGPST